MILIHQFNPEIYPYKLWIVITADEKIIKKHFNDSNDEELDVEIFSTSKAITGRVINKETRDKGILIVFKTKRFITMNTVAHESTHAARFIWNMMGEKEVIGVESDAYLVGWIAGCCENVRRYKEVKKEGSSPSFSSK